MLSTNVDNQENASVAPVQPPYTIVFPNDSILRNFANQVNQLCKKQGLPSAFIDENGALTIDKQATEIRGSTDYRFTGWGVVVLLPRLQCWVHYKAGSPEHIKVGRVLVPLNFMPLIQLLMEKFGRA
ncbi:MAG: hypothetical protein MUC48_11465 [Leptolyngbya sp. Prado105]|jgi:hypothetical protein|nr:hypothetical protein [Leptolyngbya sp. Prado105]